MNTKPRTIAQDDLVEQLVSQLKHGTGEKFPESSAAAGPGGAEIPSPPSSEKTGVGGGGGESPQGDSRRNPAEDPS